MGVNRDVVKDHIQDRIKSFLTDISPTVCNIIIIMLIIMINNTRYIKDLLYLEYLMGKD